MFNHEGNARPSARSKTNESWYGEHRYVRNMTRVEAKPCRLVWISVWLLGVFVPLLLGGCASVARTSERASVKSPSRPDDAVLWSLLKSLVSNQEFRRV